jgi:hypothetical protein
LSGNSLFVLRIFKEIRAIEAVAWVSSTSSICFQRANLSSAIVRSLRRTWAFQILYLSTIERVVNLPEVWTNRRIVLLHLQTYLLSRLLDIFQLSQVVLSRGSSPE